MAQLTRESVLAAARLYEAAKAGDPRAQFAVAESISQGDFPSQIAPQIRRTLQRLYNDADAQETSSQYTTDITLESIDVDEQYNAYGFNQDNIPVNSMGDKFIPGTLPKIGNREKYPQLGLQASGKFARTSTVGEAFGIDWQAIVNLRGTNINLLDDAVGEFATHAKQHKDAEPVKNLIGANGLINTATLGTTGHAITGNPLADDILTIQAAVNQAQGQLIDGVPVYYTGFKLLTTVANAGVVRQALSAKKVTRVPERTGSGSAVVSAQYEEIIDLGATIDVVPVKWLTTLAPTLGRAWFLIPVGGPRPLITRNFLRGYEEPGFWVKDGNAKNYNGGEVPFLDGDFDSDAIQTKVRWAFGSSTLWNAGICYSDGSAT